MLDYMIGIQDLKGLTFLGQTDLILLLIHQSLSSIVVTNWYQSP